MFDDIIYGFLEYPANHQAALDVGDVAVAFVLEYSLPSGYLVYLIDFLLDKLGEGVVFDAPDIEVLGEGADVRDRLLDEGFDVGGWLDGRF